ncbi:hypothetical protein [Paraglaciecola marina]|uniref:hypothetical protein n=1 Tax=Paraglaciecola marina TaxID=2500157 RepID=UPI00105E716A|nr:hypothetical protein [Paraglaciecola marina]
MKFLYLSCAFFFLPIPALAQVSADTGICSAGMTKEVCEAFKKTFYEVVTDENFDSSDYDGFVDSFNESFESIVKQPEFLNSLLESPSVKAKLDGIPLNMTFKIVDRENAESVLAVDFSYSKQLKRWNLNTDDSTIKNFSFDFALNGTATQKAEENPRNLIEMSVSAKWSNMPSFSAKEIGDVVVNDTCNKPEMIDDDYCAALDRSNYLNAFPGFAGTWFTNYGFDFGYEADQRFKATNRKISAFYFAAYEDFDRSTTMGKFNIKPAILISIDTVDPSAETPRAMAGDDSSYERISAEFSLSIPLHQLADIPYTLGFSYRAYQEVEASDIVKTVNLDRYRLRTYSLNTPIGLVVSYSSGRLPFGVEDENIVELGFKTYF